MVLQCLSFTQLLHTSLSCDCSLTIVAVPVLRGANIYRSGYVCAVRRSPYQRIFMWLAGEKESGGEGGRGEQRERGETHA